MTNDKATTNRPLKSINTHALWVLAVALWVAVTLMACTMEKSPKGTFKDVPNVGWNKDMSFSFTPQWSDSSARYDVVLAVRHTSDYRFRNLSLVVDLIDSAAHVDRRKVNFILADSHGNWTGAGFGSLYQSRVVVAQDVSPQQVKSIVVWQAMNNVERVKDVTDVGIIVEQSK